MHDVTTKDAWLAARKTLLAREKRFTRERDAISRARRELPAVRIDTPYAFEGRQGKRSLADLFEGNRQLIVYHFMFHPDWDAGCKSCSFWADHFDGMRPHLKQRDVNLVAISRAPIAKLTAYADRMGWRFPWYSSHGTSFNRDFGVSFDDAEVASGELLYNFGTAQARPETPGVSVFSREDPSTILHTYSAYSRGLDGLNGTYQFLDLAPNGRDEDGLSYPMAWVRRHDEYDR